MDLLKMDPMARKMEEHQKAFITALTSGNANWAKQQLNELRKVADYLSEDLSAAIAKSESGLTIGSISNGVKPSQYSRVTGTFGRYSN